jgi:hypothetical protein
VAERRILAAAEQGRGRERGGRADRDGAAVEGEQAARRLGGALVADELGVGGLERVGEDVEESGGEGAGVRGARERKRLFLLLLCTLKEALLCPARQRDGCLVDLQKRITPSAAPCRSCQ